MSASLCILYDNVLLRNVSLILYLFDCEAFPGFSSREPGVPISLSLSLSISPTVVSSCFRDTTHSSPLRTHPSPQPLSLALPSLNLLPSFLPHLHPQLPPSPSSSPPPAPPTPCRVMWVAWQSGVFRAREINTSSWKPTECYITGFCGRIIPAPPRFKVLLKREGHS